VTRILEVENLRKSFGAVVVADGLGLALPRGEALGIIGPNGAGKTSLFNMIAGVVRPAAGRVLLEGADVTQMRPDQRCRLGVGRCFQIPRPFSGLSVFENLMVAASFGGGGTGGGETRCVDAMKLTGLAPKANALAGSLTLLERKRLELARALAGQPKLLLLDEIAGGLTPRECEVLVEAILAVRATGVSIVWIEHVVHALLAIVDRLMVLHQGRKLMEGEPRAVMASREVREIYLGVEADA
jgi:branched-chain amino acid transport system ATP-binding protein